MTPDEQYSNLVRDYILRDGVYCKKNDWVVRPASREMEKDHVARCDGEHYECLIQQKIWSKTIQVEVSDLKDRDYPRGWSYG